MKKILTAMMICWLMIAIQTHAQSGTIPCGAPNWFTAPLANIQGPSSVSCGTNVSYSFWSNRTGANIAWLITPTVAFTQTGYNSASPSSIAFSFPTSSTAVTYTITVFIPCGSGSGTPLSTTKTVTVNPCATQQTIQITSGEDAMLHYLTGSQNKTNTNYGNFDANLIENWTFLGVPAVTSSVIKFNLPAALTTTSNIISAKLYLYDYCPASSGGSNLYSYGATNGQAPQSALYVKRITSNWSATSVTAATTPTSVVTNMASVPAAIIPNWTMNSDNQVIQVKLLVTDMLTSGNNYGFMLQFQDINANKYYRARSFGSFDCPTVSRRPKLEITYQ